MTHEFMSQTSENHTTMTNSQQNRKRTAIHGNKIKSFVLSSDDFYCQTLYALLRQKYN